MYDPLINPSRSITNKVDAMQFAIIATMESRCGEPDKIHYDQAKKLFDFICENVEFPTDVNKLLVEELHEVVKTLSESQNNKSLSFYDSLLGTHDAPLAAAVHSESDVSALKDAIFKPRIREGQWYCNKVSSPYKDITMAVVETSDADSFEKENYLARYCHESNVWYDINTGQIIENVVSYYPVKC